MPLFHLVIIALIQGLTEFLPISSSGHLILLPHLTGLQDQGQAIDVAVHVGTLFAVLLYFWSDMRKAMLGLPRLLMGRADTEGAKLALLLLVSAVPVIAFGLILKLTGLDIYLRSVAVIAWSMLIFGILLYWADQFGETTRSQKDWTLTDAMVVGVWQAIALIPGTSRSGITITGARFLGYNRHDAAKLSMLMSVPTIVASGVLLSGEALLNADLALLKDCGIAAALAFVAALLALSIMMRLLRTVSFTPYVIYRVILGVILLVVAYA
ncbi:undecaprenyl-diphosphate phosphatase [Roseovarius sp.]|uniref:undecaprenyl-diphosphate phosphatase n=1 Tax=Roseovarius sp. TaxID=1486281 RepID=UPI002602463A|nr:undecaprenyl-diphosphate phosphatase [Roseovarius sp.]MDM8166068.1 undecaprenyl-diphosphate phosphatase [Roseovarius sp.]